MLSEAAHAASLQNILCPGLGVLGSRDLCDGNDLHCDWISSGPPHLGGQLHSPALWQQTLLILVTSGLADITLDVRSNRKRHNCLTC